jgi:hypothetical protein
MSQSTAIVEANAVTPFSLGLQAAAHDAHAVERTVPHQALLANANVRTTMIYCEQ